MSTFFLSQFFFLALFQFFFSYISKVFSEEETIFDRLFTQDRDLNSKTKILYCYMFSSDTNKKTYDRNFVCFIFVRSSHSYGAFHIDDRYVWQITSLCKRRLCFMETNSQNHWIQMDYTFRRGMIFQFSSDFFRYSYENYNAVWHIRDWIDYLIFKFLCNYK